MKVELHCHTSRYSGCATATPAELLKRMIETGYEAVYLTEHDAVWSDWELAQLQAGFPAVRVFPGLERSIGMEPARHIVILGTHDRRYLELKTEADVLKKARDEGHLTVLAHPLRWAGGEEMLQAGHVPDALEYRTGNHDVSLAGRAEALARQYNLPLVNTGDTHGLNFLDRYWIQTDRPLDGARDIRAIILGGAYRNCVGR